MNRFDVEFRPLREVDLALVHEWTHRPHVVKWWGGAGPPNEFEHTRAKYLPRLRPESHIKPYLACLAGQPIGLIQSYVAAQCGNGWWEHETDPGVLGTDQFLSDENSLGRGIGTRMVAAFVQRLFHDPRVTKIQADPDPANARAIRCYEKVGFRLGEVEFRSIEDYGALRSLRVHCRGGIEVEFGVARPSWAKVPLDAGTKFVLAGGARILHDPRQLLQVARRAAVA